MDYQEIEKQLFNYFLDKNKSEGFTFSMRKKASKGSESDIFTGTKKSKYIATTLWNIPCSYPGASIDLLNLLIIFKKSSFHFEFKYFMGTSDDLDEQNIMNTKLFDLLILEEGFENGVIQRSGSKKIKIVSENFTDFNQLPKNFFEFILQKKTKVNNAIMKLKMKYPSWEAEDISQEDYLKQLNNVKKRRENILKSQEANNCEINKRTFWLYSPGENGDQWNEFYNNGIMAIGWDKLDDLRNLGDRDDIGKVLTEKYNLSNNPMNDSLANFEFRDIVSIGDVIIAKKGRDEYIGYGIVTSDYDFDNESIKYKSRRKVDWKKRGSWSSEHKTVLKTLTSISKYPDYVERLTKLIGIELEDNINSGTKMTEKAQNTIYFGPPGTGKTYLLSNNLFKEYTHTIDNKSREELLDNLVDNHKWFDIISAIVYDLKNCRVTDIYNHELLKAKARVSSSKSIRQAIWGTLQSHTDLACENVNYKGRTSLQIMWKNDDSTWRFHDNLDEDSISISKELLEKTRHLESENGETVKRFEFTTFHQSFSYEDFIEGIKPIMNSEDEGEVQYEIQDGIFKRLARKARLNPTKKYALFIDEINRGNVANIFGELITLIEPDKREGQENELKALLPYSKELFSVPNNLDIIGTMNTADKSVEALDTALRRRFSFTEMKPDSSTLVKNEIKCEDIELGKLLDTMNLRIEKLLDKDHAIGHSYFLKLKGDASIENLQCIFKDNILPLLQEYFYGDFGKIGLILGSAFVKETKSTVDIFHTDFNYEDRDILSERKLYKFTEVTELTEADFKAIYA